MAEVLLIIRLVLAGIMLLCSVGVIAIVIMQSSNSDGTQAFTGASSKKEDGYGHARNSGSKRTRKLQVWTYVSAGILAICSVAFLVIGAILA